MISNDKQLNLHLIGEVISIKDLPYNEVAMCSSPLQAVKHCMSKVMATEEDWATYLNTTQGTVNQVLNSGKKRKRNFPLEWINLIQLKAGNRCISQYFDLESKGQLYHQQHKEVSMTLEEENKLLKARLGEQLRMQA